MFYRIPLFLLHHFDFTFIHRMVCFRKYAKHGIKCVAYQTVLIMCMKAKASRFSGGLFLFLSFCFCFVLFCFFLGNNFNDVWTCLITKEKHGEYLRKADKRRRCRSRWKKSRKWAWQILIHFHCITVYKHSECRHHNPATHRTFSFFLAHTLFSPTSNAVHVFYCLIPSFHVELNDNIIVKFVWYFDYAVFDLPFASFSTLFNCM